MFVKWTDWTTAGMNYFGEMHHKDIEKKKAEFRKAAVQLQKEIDADHVVYAVQYYDDEDNVENVHFHMTPLDDDTFYQRTGNIKNAIVYAIHKRRR